MMEPKQPRAGRPSMPGYGIDSKPEGLLPFSWAEARLTTARNYFLSTVTEAEGGARPHVMVIWGLWIDRTFQFSTAARSRKAVNLTKNPRCVVCPEAGDQAVIVEGTAALLSDPAAIERFNQAYKTKYDWDVSTMKDSPPWVVHPRVVFGLIEESFTDSATRWIFDDAVV